MQFEAKQELANALLEAFRLREASYKPGQKPMTGRYTMSHIEAAHRATDDPDLAYLVGVLNGTSGEAIEWAEKFLRKPKAA